MNQQLKNAIAAAHTPEANAKRAATMAKKAKAKKRAATMAKVVTSIPLEAIPDDRPKAKLKKVKAKLATLDGFTREQLALEIIRLTTLLLK